MYQKGINPHELKYDRLVGHHYKQQYHRNPNAFMESIKKLGWGFIFFS
jgi:hypothetical protein